MVKRNLNIRTIKKKIEECWWHKLFKYEQDYYWKNRRDLADQLAQKHARLKAFHWKNKVKCLTCDKIMKFGDSQWCHRIEKKSSGTYRCRRKEWNIYACCEKCNKRDQQTHTRRLTSHVTKLYWSEQVEKRQAEDRQPHDRPKRYEIDEVIDFYKEKIKKLHKM